MSRIFLKACVLISAMAIAVLAIAPGARAASAEQIVFSGQTPPGGLVTTGGVFVPMGFWIWCQNENPAGQYEGPCAGSMYFYPSLLRPVFGSVSEGPTGIYTMSVSSGGASPAITCSLNNVNAVLTSGHTNDINIACAAPAVSGTFSGAVVQVTG